jgi:hypothetical protein
MRDGLTLRNQAVKDFVTELYTADLINRTMPIPQCYWIGLSGLALCREVQQLLSPTREDAPEISAKRVGSGISRSFSPSFQNQIVQPLRGAQVPQIVGP